MIKYLIYVLALVILRSRLAMINQILAEVVGFLGLGYILYKTREAKESR